MKNKNQKQILTPFKNKQYNVLWTSINQLYKRNKKIFTGFNDLNVACELMKELNELGYQITKKPQ